MKNILILFCLLLLSPLSAEVKILAFAGSTREGSLNKQLVKEAAQVARDLNASVTVIDLEDFRLPIYEADLEKKNGMPINAKRLRRLLMESDAVIIASPEYNGSLPALLKNVIDWASRNEQGQGTREAFKGKTFAIMSASPGGGGGVRGLIHLRSILEGLGGKVVPTQVAVSSADEAFDDKGTLQKENIRKELKEEMQQLLSYSSSVQE